MPYPFFLQAPATAAGGGAMMFVMLFFIIIIPIIVVVILVNKNKASRSQLSDTSIYNHRHNNSKSDFQRIEKSKTDQLFDLKKLYDAGVLTEEEFNKQKNKILNS